MRRTRLLLVGLWFLAGGVGACDSTPAPGTNGVWVVFEFDEVEHGTQPAVFDGLVLDELTLSLTSVSFEGDGPDGAESVSRPVQTVLEIVSGSADPGTPVLELGQGEYADALLRVELAPGDSGSALEIVGEQDGIPFHLRSTETATLPATADVFRLGDGLDAVVRYTMTPPDWFDGVELDEALPDGEGVVQLDEDHNSTFFDVIVADMLETTEGEFPDDDDEQEDL